MNLSTYAVSSTQKNNPPPLQKKSGFMLKVVHVKCHVSLTPTATAMDPPHAKGSRQKNAALIWVFSKPGPTLPSPGFLELFGPFL